jgi:hypothetical protein
LNIDIPANNGNLPFKHQTDYESAPSTSEPCPIGYTLQYPGYPKGECQQNDENAGETYAGSGMTLFECAAACDADSECVTFDYLNEKCYLNEYCDEQDPDNYLACRKIDYNDFSSKAAMEANGWQFTPNSELMFIGSDSDKRATFCGGNPETSYCGFDYLGAGSTSVTMRSSGTVKITYGGSFEHVENYVKLEVNGVEKSRVKGADKGYSIIRVMKDDIVSFIEVGVSVINIHEFKFEPAPFEGVEKNCDWNMYRDGRVEKNNLHCWDSGISNSTCMEKCDQHEDCKAISWIKLTENVEPQTGECCLKYTRDGDGSYSTTTDFITNGLDYKYWSCKDPYERCDWSMAVMGAISGRTIGCYDGKTPAQCKQLCEFTENCKSIDHQFDGRCCLHDCDIESECALTDSDEHMYYTCDSRNLLNTAEDHYWGFMSYETNIGKTLGYYQRVTEGDLAGVCCTPLTHTGTAGIGWPGKKYFSWDCQTEEELVAAGNEKYVKSNHAERNTYINKVCPSSCENHFANVGMLYGHGRGR